MQRRSALGKGLASLIPPDTVQGEPSALLDLPVAAIEPNPHQPRQHFDEEALTELTASIKALGVLQPVLVRLVGDGRYQLIAGERRWQAARRAGLSSIPALLRHSDEVSTVAEALVENLQRQDLSPLEEAAAYQELIEGFSLTHDEVAAKVGKSRSAVTNTVRLLQLPASIQRLVNEGRLSAGHARALLATPDRSFQEHLAKRAAADGWSVREVEEAVRRREDAPGSTSTAASRPTKLRPPGLLELEELLGTFLDTRVRIALGSSRGRVTIEFADLEDLERIYRRMTEATPAPSAP